MKDKNPVQKTHSIVFDYFTEQIFSGKLKVGSRLPPEREIAEQLGVSRNSTREAIRMLEMMGFVESIQGSGNYIRCEPQSCMVQALHMMMVLRDTESTDLFYVQRSIEQEALVLALKRCREDELEPLHTLLLSMDHCSEPLEFLHLQQDFHAALVRLSHSEVLYFISQLSAGLVNQLFESPEDAQRLNVRQMERLRSFHWELYHGLHSHDVERIRQAVESYHTADADKNNK